MITAIFEPAHPPITAHIERSNTRASIVEIMGPKSLNSPLGFNELVVNPGPAAFTGHYKEVRCRRLQSHSLSLVGQS